MTHAGAVAFRMVGSRAEFLLVTARASPGQWIFPKGHIHPGETAEDAALRELEEEAGVAGEIVGAIGSSGFQSGREEVEVAYFLVRLVRDGTSPEGRRTAWLSADAARERLSFGDARRLLDRAVEMVARR